MQENGDKIGLGSAIVVAINAMIGVGVLAMPAVLSRNVGPASILTFAISIFAVLSIGLSLGRAAELYPGEGWNYLYPSKWAGHTVGLISSWTYVIGVTVAMGFLVQQAGVWTHKLMPVVAERPMSIGILIFLTLLVLAGANISAFGQYVIAFFVVTPLIFTSVICWLYANPANFTPFMPGGITSVFGALPTALFGLFGFESVASLYSIVKNPQRNVPRAFVTAIAIVGSLYLAFVSGIIFSVDPTFFQGGLNKTLATVLQQVFPQHRFLATFVLVGATFGIIGTLHSMIWSVSALLNDVLKKMKCNAIQTACRVGLWNHVVSVLITAGSMLLISLCATPDWLINLTTVFIVPSFILSCMALLFVKREWQSGRNVITLCALAGGGLILYFALEATCAAW